MDTLALTYIDDSPDPFLSDYLEHQLPNTLSNLSFKYEEIEFSPSLGYEALLANRIVQQSNIILIDSRLFENRNASNGMFTGEEFQIILKRCHPFIEVVVITQKDDAYNPELGMLRKFRKRRGEKADPRSYYNSLIPPVIEEAAKRISAFKLLGQKIQANRDLDPVLVEKILNSLQGDEMYLELSSKDIDHLVLAFEELRQSYE